MTEQPVALITGGARRIGASLCRRLHSEGFRILLHYRQSSSAAEQLALELNGLRPDSVRLLQADLNDSAQRQQLITDVLASEQRLDVLINNASSFYPTAIESSTEHQWDDLLGSNLKAPYFLAQGLCDKLKVQQGCIVNIVDIHSQRPLQGYPIYSIAKAGLAMLTQSLAKELAPHVRVNGISPGAILLPEGEQNSDAAGLVEKTPLQRMGSPEDIADCALFMIRQTYVTGQILAVDGGKSLYS